MVVIAVALIGFASWTAAQTWSSRSTILHEQRTLLPAETNTQALLSAFIDEDTGVQGYVLTGSARDSASYRSGATEATHLMNNLQHELRGDTRTLATLKKVENRYRTWRRVYVGPEIAAAKAGDRTTAATLAATFGQLQVERVWASVTTLQDDVNRLTQQTDDSVDNTLLTTFALSVIRGGAVLMLIAVVLFFLRRWINEPVEQLAGEVRVVAGGKLDRPVEAQGPPELASLGHYVEGMRRQLRNEGDELRQLRQALVERSPLHVLLHSELEPTGDTSSFAVAGRHLPAEGILAGDWYDVWQRDGGGVAAALVDISGHGSAAGLFALKIKYLLTPAVRLGLPPGEALQWVAGECGDTDEQFATGIVVELDGTSGLCRYANAGHPSGLLFRASGVEELTATGPLMCVLPGAWSTAAVAVSSGDLLVLTTDGVIEARLPDGSEFGMAGIVEVVNQHGRSGSPDDVAESLVSAVRDRCRLPLKDDVTVVVVRVGQT